VFCLGVLSTAQARTGVGHGGGSEGNVIKCAVSAESNRKLSLTVCWTGDTNSRGQYEIIPCGNDSSAYVKIQRITNVTADSQMIETTKIPGQLFSVNWDETGFYLNLNDPTAGELSLTRLGTPDQDNVATLDINISSMKYNLKSVNCHFGSN
jgi:hypothetical protein